MRFTFSLHIFCESWVFIPKISLPTKRLGLGIVSLRAILLLVKSPVDWDEIAELSADPFFEPFFTEHAVFYIRLQSPGSSISSTPQITGASLILSRDKGLPRCRLCRRFFRSAVWLAVRDYFRHSSWVYDAFHAVVLHGE